MELAVTDDTTALSYWLNWRVLLCSIWVLAPMVVALLMICKYEGSDHLKSDQGESQQEVNRDLCGDEAWRPCLKMIHPLWLLAYRVIAFSLLLATLIAKVVLSGGGIFFYYTQ